MIPSDVTQEDIDSALLHIDKMSQEDMCRALRFSPPGRIFFRNDLPTVRAAWDKRWKETGGMTPAISKRIGWDG